MFLAKWLYFTLFISSYLHTLANRWIFSIRLKRLSVVCWLIILLSLPNLSLDRLHWKNRNPKRSRKQNQSLSANTIKASVSSSKITIIIHLATEYFSKMSFCSGAFCLGLLELYSMFLFKLICNDHVNTTYWEWFVLGFHDSLVQNIVSCTEISASKVYRVCELHVRWLFKW